MTDSEAICPRCGEIVRGSVADEQLERERDRLASEAKVALEWMRGMTNAANNREEQLKRIVEAAQAYRTAEEKADSTGEWEEAREAAVVLDKALTRPTGRNSMNAADRYAELVDAGCDYCGHRVELEHYDGASALKCWGLRCIDAKACNARELAMQPEDEDDDA